MGDHEIHIGYNGGNPIVRAIKGTHVLEYVPSKIFYKDNSFDLPAPLIHNCIHWL